MPAFALNQPIVTDQPTVQVTVDANNTLAVGTHTFELIVTDDSGNVSQPARVEIVVRDTQAPTAVIDAPTQVEFGNPFDLSGVRSSDPAPGRVVSFTWTLVDNPIRPPVGPVIFNPTGPVIDPVIFNPISPVVGPVIR